MGLVVLLLVLAIGFRGIAAAQEGQEKKAEGDKEKGTKQGAVLNPATAKRLNEAVEQIHAQHYGDAKEALGKLDLDKLSPYERSRAEQLFAVVEQAQGNYSGARDHINAAIASGGLNDQEASTARFQLAQLFMSENKWKEGAEALKQWFATAQNPNSNAYHLLAIAYYQLGDHTAALAPAQKAVELAGAKPQESWLQLVLALYLERQQYKQALPILKQLIEAAPGKKAYWLQLAGVGLSAGNPQEAAVPLEVAYRAGLMNEDQDVQRLTQVLVQATIPYRAAKILGQAIEHGQFKSDAKSYELLANCWVAARELDKAIAPLRRAADLSQSGELYLRLAQVYVQREDWPNAAGILRLALDKGKLKNTGDVQLLMGLAVYNQKQVNEARSWFLRASEHSESRSQAEGWLQHIDSEQRTR
jgi:tetratricopeptide (TPR) repeat protein